MTKALFIAATAAEITPLRLAFSDRYPMFVGGMGSTAMAICTMRAIERYKPQIVVNVGIAGAIDRSLSIGEVVTVRSDYQADLGAWREEEKRFAQFLPSIYQSNYTIEGCREVTARTVAMACNPLVEDQSQIETMEGAALFAAATACGVQSAQIRAISNYVGQNRTEWKVDEAINALMQVVLKNF